VSTNASMREKGGTQNSDPLMPDPPEPAHFDLGVSAWVLSRYADVVAALREPALRQEKPRGKSSPSDGGSKSPLRTGVLAALSPWRLEEYQRPMEVLARDLMGRLPVGCPVDLLNDVIRPWTLSVAMLVLGVTLAEEGRLVRLVRDRSNDEAGLVSALRRKLATAKYERLFRGRAVEKSTFIGISETLPAFLASAWLALLRHPLELDRLRAQPELMPRAIDELLRYVGLVHSLVRYATSQIDLAGIRIAAGDRVILKLASANRDPEQFPDPGRLDLTRRLAGHIALGSGPHSCAGVTMLRLAASVATRALLDRFTEVGIAGEIEWRRGSTLVSPARLPMVLAR
jgi:cytochrome P450